MVSTKFFLIYLFPRIVSAETILFWKLECGKYSREETIQRRKLLFYFTFCILSVLNNGPKYCYKRLKFKHHFVVASPISHRTEVAADKNQFACLIFLSFFSFFFKIGIIHKYLVRPLFKGGK